MEYDHYAKMHDLGVEKRKLEKDIESVLHKTKILEISEGAQISESLAGKCIDFLENHISNDKRMPREYTIESGKSEIKAWTTLEFSTIGIVPENKENYQSICEIHITNGQWIPSHMTTNDKGLSNWIFFKYEEFFKIMKLQTVEICDSFRFYNDDGLKYFVEQITGSIVRTKVISNSSKFVIKGTTQYYNFDVLDKVGEHKIVLLPSQSDAAQEGVKAHTLISNGLFRNGEES